jgi:hypothetical protein
LPTDNCRIEPDLAALILAWPDLSSEQRAAIMDVVRQEAARAPTLPDLR